MGENGLAIQPSLRRLLLPAVAIAAACWAPGEPWAHNGSVFKGVGTATIDGRQRPGEWDHAARIPIGVSFGGTGERRGTILIMNDETHLFLALAVSRPSLGADEVVEFHFDNRHDGRNGDLGEDVLRLGVRLGALDMYYDPRDRVIYSDQSSSGSGEIQGRVQNDGETSFFEVAHPVDTADNSHDFSLAPYRRVGFSFEFDTCFCPHNQRSTWPGPGPWADIAIAGAVPALSITSARIVGRSRESNFAGSLMLGGASSDGGQLGWSLSERDSSIVSGRFRVGVGLFQRELPLPRRLLPGTFTLTVGGTSDGYPLRSSRLSLRLAAPSEGIVHEVAIRGSSSGPALPAGKALPAGAREIWLRFRFAVRPAISCTRRSGAGPATPRNFVCDPPIIVTWFRPDGSRVGSAKKLNAAAIDAFVKSSAALTQGTWRAVLTVGKTTVRTVSVSVGRA